MKVQITIQQVNETFDQSYADQYHRGKESENNVKYHWGRQYEFEDVLALDHLRKQSREFELARGEDEKVKVSFDSLRICRLTMLDGNKYEFSVSEALVEKSTIHKDAQRDMKRFYFFLKDNAEFIRIDEDLYVFKQELPDNRIELLTAN